MKRILIIKAAHITERTSREERKNSLCELYRSTAILWEFLDCHTTWLTSEIGKPLLPRAPYVQEIAVDSEALVSKYFDVIVNLDTDSEICEFAEMLCDESDSELLQHFQFDALWEAASRDGKLKPKGPFLQDAAVYQARLFPAIGKRWQGQPYTVPALVNELHTPVVNVVLALSTEDSAHTWPEKHWQKLERLCKNAGLTTARIAESGTVGDYCAAILQGELLVTSESFGFHLGIGLQRKVVALLRAGTRKAHYLYQLGVALEPSEKDSAKSLDAIAPETVFEAIAKLLEHETIGIQATAPAETAQPAA